MAMDLDGILLHLGDFGRYQKRIYFLICTASIFTAIFSVIPAIILSVPAHRCKIPAYDNDTFSIQSDLHREVVNNYIPPSSDETLDHDQCHLYTINLTGAIFNNSNRLNSEKKTKCNEWVYSETVFFETFASKHDLVCDDGYKTSLAKSLFFVGVFVGALVFGNLSDIVGRKKAICIGVLTFLVFTLGLAWCTNFTSFAICMTCIGLATEGVYSTGFVIGLELVGPSKRIFTGVVVNYFFAFGIVLVVGISYFVRHWKYIEILCAVPISLLLLFYWCLLPESPRWLITKQRKEEAGKILQKAAKINKVVLEENLFALSMKEHEERKDGRIWQLFTSRILLMRTLVIFFNWCVVSMTYYGLSLNSGNLGGNYYLNFLLTGLVEFPAYTLILLLLNRVGRKWLHCVCMILGGMACLSTIFTILYLEENLQPVTIALAMLGKLGIAAAFGIIFMYSTELFPTVVRNGGLGASSCAARLGSVAAPYITDLGSQVGGKIGRATPMVVFGVLSIVAGLLALYLPETLNQELPETIEDGIKFGTDAYKSRKCSPPEVLHMTEMSVPNDAENLLAPSSDEKLHI